MDKEFDSNYIDDISFSTYSNDEIQKLTDLPEGMKTSHGISDNAFKKKENQYRDIQNYGHNQMMYNSEIPEPNGIYSDENLYDYIKHLSGYLRTHKPKLLEMLQQGNTGDYEEDFGRRTPLQFSSNHAICKLDFPGLTYQVAPNMIKYEGGMIIISDDICPSSVDDLPYDDYPGPLSLEKTTEEQIYSFLKDQLSPDLKESNDWDSNDLLINYLELMIKESGKPRPISILRLLNDGFEMKTIKMKNSSRLFDSVSHNSYSRASSRATSRASSRPPSPINTDSLDPQLPQNSLDTPQGPGSVSSAVHRALITVSSEQKRYQSMDKYRQYIMTGRFEEAVHFAATSGIWDHAFALALRMNNSQLINEVLVKFSRQAISSGDPLYTMHELMAQRAPKIVAANRGFSSSEMGDWRCHLSMIFSVKKYRPEESRQAIEALGEKLSALHNFYAAHLCYLLAGTTFGIDRTATRYRRKFDLIGWRSSTSLIPAQKSSYATCHKLFSGLAYWSSAPVKAIQLTEVFEYALKCAGEGRPTDLSVHLLPYKYRMVYRMLSHNQLLSAYEYCVDIGQILDCSSGGRDWLQCDAIDFRIVANIRHLAHRLDAWLRSYDESMCNDREDDIKHGWLANLDTVYGLFCAKYGLWNPSNRKPEFVYDECDRQQQLDDDNDDEYEHMSGGTDHLRGGHNGYSRYPDSVASSSFTENYIDGFPVSPGRRNTIPAQRPVTGRGAPQSMTSPQSHQQQHPQLDLRLGRMAPLRDIAPPSDLPSEAIMTEPPRFQDHNFYQPQHQQLPTARNTERVPNSTHQSYDNQRLRYDNQMKQQQPQQRPVAPPFKSSELSYHQPMNFSDSRVVGDSSFSMDRGTPGKLLKPVGSGAAADVYSSPLDTTPGSIKQQPIGIRNAFVPPCPNYGDDEDDDESRANCFVGSSSQVRSRSRSQSNGSVGSGGGGLRSRNSSESKDPPHQPLQLSASVVRTLESTKEESSDLARPSPSGPTKQQFDSSASPAQAAPPIAESKGALRGLFSRFIPSKTKEIHLPNDRDQAIMYDETKKRWVDKSNPETDKPVTPPPMLAGIMGSPGSIVGSPINNEPSYSPGGPPMNQFINSRYKLATTNVKPRTTVAMVPPAVMSMSPELEVDSPTGPAIDRHHLSSPQLQTQTQQQQPMQHHQQYNYNSIDYGALSYGAPHPQIAAGGPGARGTSAQYHQNDQIYLSQHHTTSSSSHRDDRLSNY